MRANKAERPAAAPGSVRPAPRAGTSRPPQCGALPLPIAEIQS